ncbi:MAG: hypothetical protein ACLFR0_09050 [Alphaproteobacteria bacterium]
MNSIAGLNPGFKAGWLDSPSYDTTLIVGVLVLAVASGLIVSFYPALFVPILFIDLWFLGYHHVIATFTKLAGTKEDRAQNWFLIYPLPVFVLLAVVGLAAFIGIWSVVTIYLFWQWYHYTRQSWGISAFYRRKAGLQVISARRQYLSQAAFWAVPVWGILYRCAQGWDTFLFNPVWVFPVPWIVVDIAGVITAALLLYWCYERYCDYKLGQLSVAMTGFQLSHFAIFYVGYIAIENINYGWLAANIWHNAQYILFVWLYNTNRFKHVDAGGKHALAWVSQRKPLRILAYFTACLLCTTIVYYGLQSTINIVFATNEALLLAVAIITFQTINFHHYVVDSVIWKARNKTHQRVMRIRE